MKKNIIRITSRLGEDFETAVVAGNKKYLVQTEDGGAKNPVIITRVCLNGQILSSKKTSYSDLASEPDAEKRVQGLMQRQHQSVISQLRAAKEMKARTTSEYLEEVKTLLRNKNNKSALRVLQEALGHYPDDPFLLSYFGCLDAIVQKNYREGIETCQRAIVSLKNKVPFGEDFFYPVFYLNLGRAYLAAEKKKDAIDAFTKGLTVDRENNDLLWEMKKLGMRREPAVSFLRRSNPINKYIGKLLHTLK